MTMPSSTSRADALKVAALLLFWFALTAWARPLLLPDEGRYVSSAWEMVRSGDWLTPTLDGLPFFHKPPLYYWITGGALSVFGLNEWAGRAAPITGAWIGALAMHLFTRRWIGTRVAWLTTAVLMVHPMFYIGGQYANLDMLVAGCLTATIALAAHAALSHDEGALWHTPLAAAWAMAALSMLAKGLIGLVIPALVIVPWLVLTRRWRTALALLWWPGVLLFLVIGAPWFVAMQMRFPAFLDYFFVEQHFRRFAATGFNNVMPVWFYPAVLLLFSLPWAPWLAGLRRVNTPDVTGTPTPAPSRAVIWLLVIWAAAVVGFFSMPKSKLVGYVLPALPPLACLFALGYASGGPAVAWRRRLWWIGCGVAGLVSLGAVAWLTLQPRPSNRDVALALLEQRTAGQPIVMINQYLYDVPLYARLAEPVTVVDHWDDPEIARHDNWRKEIADAGKFDKARADQLLIAPERLPALLCRQPVSWVLGSPAVVDKYPYLAKAVNVRSRTNQTLWKVDLAAPGMAAALGCR